MSASDKEISEFLCKTLEQLHGALTRFALQNAAFLVIIGGWVISSDSARDFFSSWWAVKAISVAGIVAYSGSHAFVVYGYYRRSQLAFKHLTKLNYMPAKYLELQRISRIMWMTSALAHSIISFVICLLIVLSDPLSRDYPALPPW